MTTMTKNDLPGILESARNHFKTDTVAAKPLYDWLIENNVTVGWVMNPQRRVSRGVYTLVDDAAAVVSTTPSRCSRVRRGKNVPAGLEAMTPQIAAEPDSLMTAENATTARVVDLNVTRAARMQLDNLVPDVDPTYVPFGYFRDVMMIVDSQIFYPCFITGLSGNGKSVMVEQVCARLKRNYIRVNITEETDEDDLIGGNTLINGNVVYREGPVLTAMRTGSILLLDEVDLNATKILCLQSIMEGKPYFNKKTGETIHPVRGFNIFATANTKGRGSDTGRFIGTKMMNEAFLERFPVTFEQEYPSSTTEKKILSKNFALLGCDDSNTMKFTENLTKWAETIRKSYDENSVDDVISTRRLVSIARAYAIFKDRMKALTLCLARFDDTTKEIFIDLYTKIDADVTKPVNVENGDPLETDSL